MANIIISKIESKSQLVPCGDIKPNRLWQISLFQRSKQITTALFGTPSFQLLLWQISLFQRSKANHNFKLANINQIRPDLSCGKISLFQRSKLLQRLWQNIIISKIESKSQHFVMQGQTITQFVANIIISKIESKSTATLPVSGCGKYSESKIVTFVNNVLLLWQISLFQRSKANHKSVCHKNKYVVANIIISKIESKSQPFFKIGTFVVANIIISKIESKSQQHQI